MFFIIETFLTKFFGKNIFPSSNLYYVTNYLNVIHNNPRNANALVISRAAKSLVTLLFLCTL